MPIENVGGSLVMERDAMSNLQRTDTRVFYILVGTDMRPNALAGLARLGFPAIFMAMCGHYDSLIAEIVEFLNLCIEKEQFIVNGC